MHFIILLTIFFLTACNKNNDIAWIDQSSESSLEDSYKLRKKVASALNLEVIAEDHEGNPIPLTPSGHDNIFKLKLKDRTILEGGSMSIIGYVKLRDESLIIVDHSYYGVGGELQSLVSISQDSSDVVINGDFATMDTFYKIEKISDTSANLIFYNKSGCGLRSVYKYQDGKIDYLVAESKSDSLFPPSLKTHIRRKDIESIISHPEIKGKLRAMMREEVFKNFQTLMCTAPKNPNLRRYSDPQQNVITIQYNPFRLSPLRHAFQSSNDAIISINLENMDIYAGYLDFSSFSEVQGWWSANSDDTAKPIKIYGDLYLYSSNSAIDTDLPQDFKNWINLYPDAKKKWYFSDTNP